MTQAQCHPISSRGNQIPGDGDGDGSFISEKRLTNPRPRPPPITLPLETWRGSSPRRDSASSVPSFVKPLIPSSAEELSSDTAEPDKPHRAQRNTPVGVESDLHLATSQRERPKTEPPERTDTLSYDSNRSSVYSHMSSPHDEPENNNRPKSSPFSFGERTPTLPPTLPSLSLRHNHSAPPTSKRPPELPPISLYDAPCSNDQQRASRKKSDEYAQSRKSRKKSDENRQRSSKKSDEDATTDKAASKTNTRGDTTPKKKAKITSDTGDIIITDSNGTKCMREIKLPTVIIRVKHRKFCKAMVHYVVIEPRSGPLRGRIPALMLSHPTQPENRKTTSEAELLPLHISQHKKSTPTVSPLLKRSQFRQMFANGHVFKLQVIAFGRHARAIRPDKKASFEPGSDRQSRLRMLRSIVFKDIQKMPLLLLRPLKLTRKEPKEPQEQRLSEFHPDLRIRGLKASGGSRDFAKWFKYVPPNIRVNKNFKCDAGTFRRDTFKNARVLDEYLGVSEVV